MSLAANKVAVLQVARRQLALTDDDYRAVLFNIGGVRSSKELTDDAFDAVMFRLSITPATAAASTAALVFAGFPTTSTRQCFSALVLIAAPMSANMLAFLVSRSFRSIPGLRGNAPRTPPEEPPAGTYSAK